LCIVIPGLNCVSNTCSLSKPWGNFQSKEWRRLASVSSTVTTPMIIVVVWLKIWWMENIVAKNIKDLFQIYFVLKICLWTINIFLYHMMDDSMQIYFEREYYIFMQIFFHWRREEKIRNVSSVWYSFQIYELYFSINIHCINVNLEIEGAETRV